MDNLCEYLNYRDKVVCKNEITNWFIVRLHAQEKFVFVKICDNHKDEMVRYLLDYDYKIKVVTKEEYEVMSVMGA